MVYIEYGGNLYTYTEVLEECPPGNLLDHYNKLRE